MRKINDKERFVVDNFYNMTYKEMANILDINQSCILYYARKNNHHKKFKFSEDEIEYMKQHYSDMEYKEIAKYLGYTERQVRGKINNLGLGKLRKINDDYFNNIDTPLKAYFLGFIFADGYIIYSKTRGNYEFGMQLQSCDKYILEKLNLELGGVNIIYHIDEEKKIINGVNTCSGEADCLRVYSKQIVTGLMKNGIETQKTKKTTYPIINEEYLFDFLRGYIDGDGCYYFDGKKVYMNITCGTDAILKHIQQRLLKYNITTHVYKEKDHKYRLICTNTPSMYILINKLYYDNNVLFLKRKYEKIKSYLGSAA